MNPRLSKTLKEYVEALLIAMVLALFIRGFVVQAFKIPSGSMLETLQIGDHLLVTKFQYGIQNPFGDGTLIPVGKPQRQDIVVFKHHDQGKERVESPLMIFYPYYFFKWLAKGGQGEIIPGSEKDFIKRIVGVPGDVLEIRNKKLFRNGQPVDEPYVRDARIPPRDMQRDNMAPVQVPDGKYFVMGDNRDESWDSRYWGFVDGKDIVGKAWIIYWSWAEGGSVRFGRIGNSVK